ncbi:MAG: leucyl/phenylalanyl-tRNA--protein transferase [Verrucomicrobia bacterium]|nr:leucyl/phenylalanyl-tRNA--protein transferase [Verrucomicrobiota bacterium]
MATIIPPDILLDFYRRGVFPMAMDGELRLFSPDPRGVIPLEKFRVPHGSRKTLRDPEWKVTVNAAFEEVVLGCAERDETWIDETIFGSYAELHHLGHAHSIEVWRDGELAGGLYGVAIGAAFCGESMFSRVPGASKVALANLVERLRGRGFVLLDTQWVTPHLEKFGACEIPRSEYLEKLAKAVEMKTSFWE